MLELRWTRISMLLTALVGLSCSSSEQPPQTVTFNIHTTGDSVPLAGGLISIIVQPSGISENATVTATAVDSTTVPYNSRLVRTSTYKIAVTPATMQVLLPIRVRVLTGAFSTLPPGILRRELRLNNLVNNNWSAIPGGTNDTVAGQVTASITQFNDLGLLAVPVDTLTVTPGSVGNLTVGGQAPLTIVKKDSLGNVLPNRKVTFSSSDSTKATVDSLGVIHGIAAGTAQITVTCESRSKQVSVTVTGSAGGTPTVWFELNYEKYKSTGVHGAGFDSTKLLQDVGSAPPATFVDADVNPTQIFLDTLNAPPGTGLTRSMRFDQQDQTANVGTSSTGRCGSYSITRDINLPATVPELWIETIEKFSVGWTSDVPAGWGCTSFAGWKHFFAIGPGTGPRYDFGVDPHNGGQWSINYPPGTANNVNTPFTASVNPADGQWHVYRLHMKVSTTTTSADGEMDLWMDGVHVQHLTGLNNKDVNNAAVPGVFRISHGRNINAGPQQNQSVWFGRDRVYITNPGW